MSLQRRTCPCGSGLPFLRCCGSKAGARRPGDPDRAWVEAQVMGEGDLLLYGRLQEELDETDPAVFWGELRAAAEPYLAGGPNRTAAWHARLDTLIDGLVARDVRFGYPPPYCHKGCANCCHEVVYSTDEEAAGILDYCRTQGLPLDRAKLLRQRAHITFDAQGQHTGETTWSEQPREDQACVFLSPVDRTCTIWPVRPAVCRVHLAEGTDAFCTPHNGVPHPDAQGIDYVELGYQLSVVFTVHRTSVRKTLVGLLLEGWDREPGLA